MSANFAGWDDGTLDLAIERATLGLSDADARRLQQGTRAQDVEAIERAVAALHVAALGALDAPPRALVSRLEQSGRELLGGPAPVPRTAPSAPPSPRSPGAQERMGPRALALSGWIAAAAAALVLLVWRGGAAPAPDARTARATLVASAADLTRAEWSATEDPLSGGAAGDVVWSGARQEGYMRFRALPANDATRHQYQLWIFDRSRPDYEQRPVDGGVFDVGPGEEVVVPIDAKLAVREPVLFAVTLEPPGGVVVSQREHLLLTAAPE